MCFKSQIVGQVFCLMVSVSMIAPTDAATFKASDETAEKVQYDVRMTGLQDTPFESELKNHLSLIKFQSSTLVSKMALKKRIQNDIDVMKRFFASKGYFETSIAFEIQKDPRVVMFKIILGPQYRFKDWIFIVEGETSDLHLPLPLPREGKVESGRCVKLQKVLDFKERILKKLFENGYPFAKITNLVGHVNRESKTLTIKVTIAPHIFTRFGKTHIQSFQELDPRYIQNRLQWKEGDPFNTLKIEETRTLLNQTRLFKELDITYDEQATYNGNTPINIKTAAAKPRTIQLGAKYSTSERLAAEASWQHRNFYGNGELFKTRLSFGALESVADFDLNLPDFFGYQRSVLFNGDVKRMKTQSYNVAKIDLGVGFEQTIDKKNKFTEGVVLITEKTKQKDATLSSSLVTVPLAYNYDSTNDLQNPKEGARLNVSTIPAFGKIGRKNTLLTTKIYGSTYVAVDASKKNILAGWARLGMIMGPPVEGIPADMRLYAGGNSSVRGYGYQKLAPLDSDGIPTGGKTSTEAGIEYRAALKKDWGAVAFVETAKISSASQSSDFLTGVGLGARYETRFGVIRVDLAFPLKRRKNSSGKTVDAPFQLYASIGQAF